jgi:hypothetical protein
MRVRIGSISAAALLLAACGGPDPGTAEPEEETTGQRVLLDYAERPLESARGVEDLNLQRKDLLDQQMDEAQR